MNIVRVGNGQGFWGDDGNAPARLLAQQPDLDYLTMDYLAEVSLSIMAAQRKRHPELGYASDFVDVIRSLAPFWKSGSATKLITNAGGLNPLGCAEACLKALREEACRGLRIGVVTGDDVIDLLRTASHSGEGFLPFNNLETGEPMAAIQDRLVTANAYFGVAPVVKALRDGADIVLTGRVADPSLVCAPCMYHFGWPVNAWDRIAGGLLAGHIIECGVQVSGGISTDWLDVPEPELLGFPFVEMEEDGSFVVTKPRESGGTITEGTVKEQILYEIGDPGKYLSPDATVSLLDVGVIREDSDRVRVAGARGEPPTAYYKVSACYEDGYWAQGSLTIFGRNAVAKASRCGQIVLERLRRDGFDLERTQVECLGTGACAPNLLPETELMETVLRIAVADHRREAVERFTRELSPLVTAGPQGVTGFSAGRPRVSPVFGYWPCLVPKDRVNPQVAILEV